VHKANPWNSLEANEYYFKKLGDEEKIRFSQPEKKIILNETDSINEYLVIQSKNI